MKQATLSTLEGEPGHRLQLGIWGYAIQGNIGNDVALIAEGYAETVSGRLWDRTAADLAGQVVSHGDGAYRRVKDSAALPWLTEHVLRGHAGWPGL